MKRPMYCDSITRRQTGKTAVLTTLFLCRVFAFSLAGWFFTGCQPAAEHANATRTEVLHYVPKGLLVSDEFTNAVGAPPTDAAIIQADNEGLQEARKGFSLGDPQYRRATNQEYLTIEVLDGSLGPWFQVKNLPLTSNLLQRAFEDTWVIAHRAKDLHFRHRPDPAFPTSSYPSAHSTEGAVLTTILEWLDPKREAQLVALNDEIGSNRVLLRRHYPSDVKAGRHLGEWVAQRLHDSKQFSQDFAAAQKELQPYLGASY